MARLLHRKQWMLRYAWIWIRAMVRAVASVWWVVLPVCVATAIWGASVNVGLAAFLAVGFAWGFATRSWHDRMVATEIARERAVAEAKEAARIG